MEYTKEQKKIYNEVCNKYKHNWLDTTVSQTMAMEMISKALTIPIVVVNGQSVRCVGATHTQQHRLSCTDELYTLLGLVWHRGETEINK